MGNKTASAPLNRIIKYVLKTTVSTHFHMEKNIKLVYQKTFLINRSSNIYEK